MQYSSLLPIALATLLTAIPSTHASAIRKPRDDKTCQPTLPCAEPIDSAAEITYRCGSCQPSNQIWGCYGAAGTSPRGVWYDVYDCPGLCINNGTSGARCDTWAK